MTKVDIVDFAEGTYSMATKKKSTADKITDQENRLKLLRAKQAYETAKAAITKK